MPVALAVTVSPRLPGLLSPAGWRALSGERPLVALPGAAATAEALRAEGLRITDVADAATAAAHPDAVVALVGPGEPVEAAELVDGAPEPPGSRLLDVVSVMDRLRSPGGCPWDAEQTHASLRGYLLEEAHEAYDAIVDDDPVAMREELGDVLLQVVFHARVAAEEGPDRAFSVDDVAGDLVDKLVRRHPHVFSDVEAATPDAVAANWETIKAGEKQHRTHPVEGVPHSLPALARAEKYVSRLRKAGRDDLVDAAVATGDLGAQLLDLVRRARAEGVDAEAALRDTLRGLAAASEAAALPASDDTAGPGPAR